MRQRARWAATLPIPPAPEISRETKKNNETNCALVRIERAHQIHRQHGMKLRQGGRVSKVIKQVVSALRAGAYCACCCRQRMMATRLDNLLLEPSLRRLQSKVKRMRRRKKALTFSMVSSSPPERE